jgi:hydrogenase maturation protease
MSLPSPSSSTPRRVLIACIGNIFLGDDGFGIEVAQRLQSRRYPEGVQVVDFGIRGLELAYALLDDYDTLVLVDAVPRGGPPGTLYLIEPDLSGIDPETGAAAGRIALDAHSMDPVKVLAFARALGARPIRTLLVGCEPATPGGGFSGAPGPSGPGNGAYEEMWMGLSEPVQAAVDGAVQMIDSLVAELLGDPEIPFKVEK